MLMNHLVDAWAEKEKKKTFCPEKECLQLDLEKYDKMEQTVTTGDLYVFNGQFLHAVTDYKGE